MQRFEGRILDIDLEIILKWGEANAQLQKISKPMPIMDSLIASSCLAKEFVLITRNEKDFYSFEMDIPPQKLKQEQLQILLTLHGSYFIFRFSVVLQYIEEINL
ncbi:MAG: hypothetical protein QM493_06070 [Sulfurovum sp.]